MRLWARARSVMPSWDRPRSRMACFTRAVIPATWGAAMEVPPHELILIGLAHCAVDGVDVAARGP